MEQLMLKMLLQTDCGCKNQKKGGGVLYPYASLVVQFKGLHQVTLPYSSILRPSQHPPFFLVSSLHHTLVSYLHTYTHTHKRRCSLLMWMKSFSQILVFLEQRKQHFTGLSAAVDTFRLLPLRFRTLQNLTMKPMVFRRVLSLRHFGRLLL